jgi:hypothetical protein
MLTKDMLTSLVRTIVPMVVPWVIFLVPQADVNTVTLVVSQVAYYVVFRLGEQLNPKIGWALGKAKAPAYNADAN